MSDLFRAKIAKIPLMPAELMPLDEEAEDDQLELENDDYQDPPQSQTSDDSSASSTATIKAPTAFTSPEQSVLKFHDIALWTIFANNLKKAEETRDRTYTLELLLLPETCSQVIS